MKALCSDKLDESFKAFAAPDSRIESREFWSDFKARAQLHPQRAPVPAGASRVRVAWAWGGALASLAALLLLVWSFLPSLNSPPLNVVKSFEVLAPHNAVLIVNDAQRRTTILWVGGMEEAQ